MADAMSQLVIDDMQEDIDDDALDIGMGELIDTVLGEVTVEDADMSSDYPEDNEEEIDNYHLDNFVDDYLERDPLPREM